MAISKGILSIENMWNEDIKKIEIIFQNNGNEYENAFIFYNVANGKTLIDSAEFTFSTTENSHWKGNITTVSGIKWSSGDYLLCKINDRDNGKVTISFNGNTKSMFVNYPVSISCSKEMYTV
ncbi:TPA: hypothetical protein ACS7XF_003658 [Providencia alcalifaciens]